MHPAYIQAEIKKAGYTQKQIAKEFGCSEFHVHRVIHEGKGSEPLISFICEKIGREIHQVFPKHYYRQKRRPKNTVSVINNE